MYLCKFNHYEEANKVFDKLKIILNEEKFIKHLQILNIYKY